MAEATQKKRRLRLKSRADETIPLHPFYGKKKGSVSFALEATLFVVVVFGLLMLFTASYATAYKEEQDSYAYIRPQAILALVGWVAMIIISHIDYHFYRHFTLIGYGLTIAALILVFFCPLITDEPFHRWINFPWLPFTIQPSEMGKFMIVMVTADLYQKNRHSLKKPWEGIFLPALWAAPILVLIWEEPHKSATIICVAILGTIMVACGANLLQLALAGAGGVLVLVGLLYTAGDYSASRLGGGWGLHVDLALLQSDTDTYWQILQSLYAIASGGINGVGIGNSKQKHMWLPEATNDFIFSVLCEELGFIGAVLCMALFFALILQCLRTAVRAPDIYGSVIAMGVTAQIAFQVLFNIGVVTATLPNTGISLPFFSSGGTSLLLLLLEMGVLLSVNRAGNQAEEQKKMLGNL